MLDNMSLGEMKRVVDSYAGRIPIEVSGNVSLERAGEIAALGVDFISVGALTHSPKALDISLEFLS
jgi:nicotinate-nucleotide pyrophosphorylase (carboxylating)